jgi:hypothetical protein
MSSKIILKKSVTAAKVPVVGDLDYGELALNYYDGKLYYKKSDGVTPGNDTVESLGGAAGTAYLYKTSAYTASKNEYIYADVTSGSFTITLPATPAVYDVVYITDYKGLFGTANVTVARNGSTIEGNATDAVLSFANKEYTFVYIGSTWQIFTKEAQQGVTSAIYITGPTTGNEGTDILLNMNGWSAASVYTPSASGGTVTMTSGLLRWTLPSVTADTVHTLTVSITGGGSYTHSVNVINISTSVDTSISVTDFSIKDSSTGWTIP